MYYLWLNEAQAGPYTLQQVRSMWNGGQITARTLYFQEGMSDWKPLGDITAEIETPAAAPAPPATTESHTEQDLWTGHPTLWKWAGLFLVALVLLLLPFATYLFLTQALLPVLAPLPFALLIFLHIFLARRSTTYTVSNKRVGVETGIFNKSSRELRVQDIRSIAAKTNFLGYGDIEFSSAASDDADVIFTAVAGAASVRDLVKKLQS